MGGGGGGQNSPLSLTFICNGKKLKFEGGGRNNPMRSSISDQCYFYAKYNKNASTRAYLHFWGGGGGQNSPLSLTFICNGKKLKFEGGGRNNPMRSSISDQCYFYAKYNKNASTRAYSLKFLGSKITHGKCVAIIVIF